MHVRVQRMALKAKELTHRQIDECRQLANSVQGFYLLGTDNEG